ncbi:MAG: hypothetical protein COU07_03065 [Candidatus Harrisonbacteria bacterium CG10_big_fil_rev_8_21_14_0_10_40_38]|uniref:O-antigen ligase-related domain-containing protein n=1 Tax=Candidatus Harrisonbacteria bacterium CG10_big_fil_rev_8_21_14_0_10_40_38 TaxID=1974583 RepID=A0A2H0URM7_9BACT|nr:MAG: hypothetical protein COU07_03065 [Candidatus Harrisonbacteria bacterium CG10_big_fil_rev_8_21_14_0_10_40_38]
MKENIKNIFEWAIKIFIFIIPFLTLLIEKTMLFPYITGRNFWFRILIEIGLILWIGLLFTDKKYWPKKTYITIAVAVFMLIVGLADIMGVDPSNSFWSRYERMEGYISILHLVGYFFLLSSVFQTKKDWKILLNLFLVSGVFLGVYGILQRIGVIEALQGGQYRVDGRIGNPTYFAAYLFFMVILSLLFFIQSNKKLEKYIYGFLLVFFLVIIYLTGTRGVVIALLTSAILFPVLYLIFGRNKDHKNKSLYTKISIGILGVSILMPALFWAIKDTSLIQNNYTLARFANISLSEKTTRSRFMVWGMAWEGFKERPILGWGQENYVVVFAKHYNPSMYDQEPWFDRAHNIIFDWLINAGALGLISYLSLFIAAYITIWKLYKKKIINFGEAAVLGVLLIGYMIQNLFVFDNFNSYILFFGVLAYINSREKTEKIESHEAPLKSTVTTVTVATAASALLIFVVMYYSAIRPMQEAKSIIKTLEATGSNGSTPESILNYFKKTLSYKTFGDGEAREQLSRLSISLLNNHSIPISEKVDFVKFAINEIEKQIKDHPLDLKSRLALGTLQMGLTGIDVNNVNQARITLNNALKLSPTRQHIYFLLADSYLIVNDFNGALDPLEKAALLEPNYLEAQVNLAKVAIHANRDDLVVNVVHSFDETSKERAIRLGNRPDLAKREEAQSLASIGDVYIDIQNLAKALIIYKEVVSKTKEASSDPQSDAQYYANLGGLYLSQGFRKEAREAVDEAVKLDSDNFKERADQFIKENNL